MAGRIKKRLKGARPHSKQRNWALKPERYGQLAFAGMAALALFAYGMTAPHGLPWNASADAIARGDDTFPWLYFVQVFGGHFVALACVCAAASAGLVAAIVRRLFGMRIAMAAALVWLAHPSVWNRAVIGDRSICRDFAIVLAVWCAQTLVMALLSRLGRQGEDAPTTGKRAKLRRWIGTPLFVAALAYALFSASHHDDRLGEAATTFAQGVIEESRGRLIVLDGTCDAQIEALSPQTAIPRRNDAAVRAHLTLYAERHFPGETNLCAAVQKGTDAFVAAASKEHPESFHFMDGRATMADDWLRRWSAFKPHLGSGDPFVPLARQHFVAEGKAVAAALNDPMHAKIIRSIVEDEVMTSAEKEEEKKP